MIDVLIRRLRRRPHHGHEVARSGYVGFDLVERCACGAMRVPGRFDEWWMP